MNNEKRVIRWETEDFEQRLGFQGARLTSTNGIFTFLFSVFMTAGFYLVLWFIPYESPRQKLIDGGFIPYFIVFFSAPGCGSAVTTRSELLGCVLFLCDFVSANNDPKGACGKGSKVAKRRFRNSLNQMATLNSAMLCHLKSWVGKQTMCG